MAEPIPRKEYLERLKKVKTSHLKKIIPEGDLVQTSVIKIKCPIHGWYETTLGVVLRDCECIKCTRGRTAKGQRKSREDRIAKAKEVHGDKYDYSLWPKEIVNNKIKVKTICPEHGLFVQRLNDHLSGKGCVSCTKNACDKAYVHLISDGNWNMCLKFGIAKNVERRIKEIQSQTKLTVNNLYKFQFSNPKKALEAEQEIKSNVKGFGMRKSLPDGFTETTNLNELDYIINTFKKYGGERI